MKMCATVKVRAAMGDSTLPPRGAADEDGHEEVVAAERREPRDATPPRQELARGRTNCDGEDPRASEAARRCPPRSSGLKTDTKNSWPLRGGSRGMRLPRAQSWHEVKPSVIENTLVPLKRLDAALSIAQWASMGKQGSDSKEYMRQYKSRHTNDIEVGVGKVD